MQLIIGGAYSGKRKLVRNQYNNKVDLSWLSSYESSTLGRWREVWQQDHHLVIEGWETWLCEDVRSITSLSDLRQKYNKMFKELINEETIRNKQVILIMLEMGKGIVPVEGEDRRMRDLAGWIQQDAASLSTDVFYVWHGLSRRMK
ncbi:bifunctional adenosylcobinamide kinase/adenosylcobinamide-phosphate guanylyltransferase [Salipaludibacillus daqingensis]|uniref:bifunctional adenosylcobinamide kinase/adenosylcobinamide-phosphate guanylyltransferase n=1 Tax=Salipaludibacillus daqingensis TaxID=3041001 RepID=UPI0024772465|nr:bifunctional adenosylcobinamide kinase/adenosylcobinamide-phosphate guanylyltransferase [Salipaludibacillus daqingensis]